jgi:hypothetical protein
MAIPSIVETNEHGRALPLFATTVRGLGKPEHFLEDVIEASPFLLELESDGSGTRGPFKICRQNDLLNAVERAVVPDLVIMSASGHVTIVEVKLHDNPELRDRRVVAQILDYVGAFVERTEDELLAIFSRLAPSADSWEQLVATFFPDEPNFRIIAERIASRFRRGEVNCVVACDVAPPGLARFLSSISRQSALPFTLSLAEITPFVRDKNNPWPVVFVSSVLLRTEIVSRTAVTVRYEEGSNEQPSVSVETTSIDEIEQNLADATDARSWTVQEIEDAVRATEDPIVGRLFELAKTESGAGQLHSPGKKRNPVFGFYITRTDPDGTTHTKQVFNYRVGDPTLRIYLNMLITMVPERTYELFVKRLKELFPKWTERDLKEPWIPLTEVETKFEEFRKLLRSVVDQDPDHDR